MLLIFVLAFIAFSLLRVVWNRYKIFSQREQLGFKGPKASFFTGNLGELMRYEQKNGRAWNFAWGAEQQKKYGKIFGLYFGPMLQIILTDLDFIKEVWVRQFHNFVDRMPVPFNEVFPMTDSLLAARGERWKAVRSTVTPTFSAAKLKMLCGTFNSKIDTFLECMAEHAASGQDFDIYDDFQALTVDVIGKCAFAIDTDCQKNREESFYVNSRNYIAKSNIQENIVMALSFIVPELTWLTNFVRPWTPIGRAEKTLLEGLEHAYDYRKLHSNDFTAPDMLHLMLESENQQASKSQRFDRDVIVSNMFAILLAGYETTSTSLSYTAWLLAKHADVQTKLQREIDDKLAKLGISPDKIDYDVVKDMPYLDAVFRESLRIMPPVASFTTRQCISDTEVNGVFIPKGLSFMASVYAIHHDPDVWPEPALFKPERFLTDERRHPMAWMPFGAGPRNCIGLRFAEIEFKMTLFRLAHSFTLRLGPAAEDPLQLTLLAVLLRPVNGVFVTVEKR